MQAGGIGSGKKVDSIKDTPKAGQKLVVMGGDNYRIGMIVVSTLEARDCGN